MAKGPSFFFFFILFLCNAAAVTCSDIPLPHTKDLELFPSSIHRALMEYFPYRITQLDTVNPPMTPPITNPVIAPPTNSVTVPGANPPPVTNPVNPSPVVTNPPPVSTNPPPVVTNPVNPPPVVTNPPPVITNPPPVTNPVNPPPVPNPPSVTNPVNSPPANNVNPTGSGRWCIAKNGASQAALQLALDYACGVGGADCVTIQQGSSCYEPATLQNHASYAFNSYYQKNPAPTSCDFGGAAVLTTTNPSTGSCIYPSSSSSPLTPPVNATSLPTAPPTSSSSSGQGTRYPPPPGFSFGNPNPTGLGAYGASPPLTNTVSDVSNNLQPFIGSFVTAASACIIIMFGL